MSAGDEPTGGRPGATGTLLGLAAVTRRFPGVLALDAVDFDLRAGEVHALLGENGAGKSTLINLVSGVLAPDSGQILLDGHHVSLDSPTAARRLGIVTVHQEADLFGTLSVAENMALAQGLPTGALGWVRWREVERQARAAVASLGEPIAIRQPAARLSLAHRQMIQVAAAVAHAARVVILDEPTSALSVLESAWLFDHVRQLRARGVGVIYVSHRLEEVFQLSDRITVLRDGKRVWSGATADIDRAALVHAMVGRDDVPAGRSERAPRPQADAGVAPILRVHDFHDRAGRFGPISLDLLAGEILGLYGLVGAGRSEWAQALFGWHGGASGSVEIAGQAREIRHPGDAVRAGLAYVPEDRLRQGICPGLSVRANTVLSVLRCLGRSGLTSARREREATRHQVAELGVRLRSIAQPIRQLSGGNQQKVVLGRWRLVGPRVLILDEPTRGVDVSAKAEIHRLIRQLADSGRGIILISSELPEVLAHSDRIAVFREGQVAALFEACDATPVALAQAALPDTRSQAAARRAQGQAPPSSLAHALRDVGLIAALLVLGACLAMTTRGRFLAVENLLGVLSSASVIAILALGAAAVLIAGGIDISIGSLLALAAASGGLVLARMPGPEALAVPVALGTALAVGAAGGLLNAALALGGRIHPIVVTLGTLTVYRGLLLSLTGGDVIGGLPASFRAWATGRVAGVPGSVIVLLAVAGMMHLWLGHTRSGRFVFALGANPRAARVVGIRQSAVWLTAFAVGGLCAALAGLLELAQNGSMQSVLGTGYELRAIAAAVIGGTAVTGGRGSVVGVVLGALLLTLIQNALVLWSVSRYHYDLVIGALLLAAILLDLLLRVRPR